MRLTCFLNNRGHRGAFRTIFLLNFPTGSHFYTNSIYILTILFIFKGKQNLPLISHLNFVLASEAHALSTTPRGIGRRLEIIGEVYFHTKESVLA